MNIERKPELKHNEALLRQIIKRIDVNDCTGNSDLVMKIAKAYADEIIEPPITSEPPRQVSDEEINLMAQKYIKGMAVEPQTESIYYAYYHGASDMRDLLTKNKGETK